MSWRVSKALLTLRAEVEKAHPGRSRVSDGTVGDTSHSARVSDHNPDENGIVHAWDVTVWDDADPDNLDDVAQPLAEFLRAKRDPRTKYVIHRGQMFRGYDKPGIPAWTWSPYTGPNGHFHHVHVSVYGDDGAPWGYPGTTTTTPTPEPPKGPLMALTDAEQTEILTKVRDIHAQTGMIRGFVDAVLEAAEKADALFFGTGAKRLRDRAGHLNPFRKK